MTFVLAFLLAVNFFVDSAVECFLANMITIRVMLTIASHVEAVV